MNNLVLTITTSSSNGLRVSCIVFVPRSGKKRGYEEDMVGIG